VRAFIGLGSNLGDREANLRQALESLAQAPQTTVVRASSLYDTEPIGVEDQPHFLNAVAQLETQLTPRQLLWNLMLVERRLGRVRTQRWGPRTIDLDLLLYEDVVMEEDDLELPHPELAKRSFVLVPLVELEPLLPHPVTGETMLSLLQRLGARPLAKHGSRIWN
jgi:2-amino-4-hydroxy-6-hydroxymethyldihydropteridine diphosphokinase